MSERAFQRLWRRLQQLGLNAYEARSYLVLIGHPRFKALELAARARVPRQKIYEVLSSLLEKGFAQAVQEKTKLFSAVEPALAIPAYLERKRTALEHELAEQSRLAGGLIEELNNAYSTAQGGRGTLDYLSIVSDPAQTAAHYHRMLLDVETEYLEFSRPPYAVDPLQEQLVQEAAQRGVRCRLLLEDDTPDRVQRRRLTEYAAAGVEIRHAPSLPMKLALFDGYRGMIALLDPVITRPAWTALIFEHPGMGEAMKGFFEDRWRCAQPLPPSG